MMIGLKVLERLRTGWQDGRMQLQSLLNVPAANSPPTPKDEQNEQPSWPPTLETLLEHAGELSPYTLALGVCQDGLPFLLDLTNPAPGALLIASDRQGGKTRLLKSLLTAARTTNTAEQVVFYVLAGKPDEYESLSSTEHCRGILPSNGAACSQLIQELAVLAETRRRSPSDEPSIILAIDDLADCSQALDQHDFARLYWLIHHGPRSFIWPIVTLCAEDAQRIHPRLLSVFRTRLIGFIHNDEQAAFLSQDERLDARWIEEGKQFYVPYGEEWLPLWICDPMNERQRDPVFDEKPDLEEEEPSLPILFLESDALRELKAWNERLRMARIDEPADAEAADNHPENRYQSDSPPLPSRGEISIFPRREPQPPPTSSSESSVAEKAYPLSNPTAQDESTPAETYLPLSRLSMARFNSEAETTRPEHQRKHFPIESSRSRSRPDSPNNQYPERAPRSQDPLPTLHRNQPDLSLPGSGMTLDHQTTSGPENFLNGEPNPEYSTGPVGQPDQDDDRAVLDDSADLYIYEYLEETQDEDIDQSPGQSFDYEYIDDEEPGSTDLADDRRQAGGGNGHHLDNDPGRDRR